MTTNDLGHDAAAGQNLGKLEANLQRIEELNARLVSVLTNKRQVPQALQGPGQDLYVKTAAALMAQAMQNPAQMIEQQVGYWGKTLKHYVEAQQTLAKGDFAAPPDPGPKDRRFANPLWDTHPYFNFLKQQYQMNAAVVRDTVARIEGLDPTDRQRLDFFATQIVDMMAPTNFLATNPDALERAVETEGESLVKGLENLIADLEANDGELVVTLADKTAFTVGENIGTSKGEVVFRNRMLELIQYAPTTETVHDIPLLIFPPWINKFYILDLKEQNSLIKWVVDQGYTLFVVSWVNPDAAYSAVGLSEYIEEGYLTALAQVKSICQVETVNVVGYCIAGTTLALTLALLNRRGDTSVNSATFFTTLTDFSNVGEVGVFLSDDFVDGLVDAIGHDGILDRFYMARTFTYLRSNDLVYQPAIKSYMLGQTPPAFDLLFWNGDGTNLPGRMAVEYLRGLCQKNDFASAGFEVCGERVQLSEVRVPVCSIACETDHIARWKSCYQGVQQMGSPDKTFILSESGHIAGIVNPPSKVKYGHWANPDLSLSCDDWQVQGDKHEGSWWPRWEAWLRPRSGTVIPARGVGDAAHPSLAPAPGTYVTAVPVPRG